MEGAVSGLEQHVKEFRWLVFLACDAGRITESRGRELLGHEQLIDFRDAYQNWREERKRWDAAVQGVRTLLPTGRRA